MTKIDNFLPVPAITINNKLNDEARTNLLKVACNNYKGYDLPDECYEHIDSGVTSCLGSMVLLLVSYILSQLFF